MSLAHKRSTTEKGRTMSQSTIGKRGWVLVALAATALALAASALAASDGQTGFGFNAREISGFPTGAAFLTGGGAFNPDTGFVHSGGGFRCTSDIHQGPAYRVSRGRRRSLGHGRSPKEHELQVHRGGGRAAEDRKHR